MIEKLGIGQGGSSDFSAGARDVARSKNRSEDEKYEVKPTPTQGPPNNALLFGVGPKPIFQSRAVYLQNRVVPSTNRASNALKILNT